MGLFAIHATKVTTYSKVFVELVIVEFLLVSSARLMETFATNVKKVTISKKMDVSLAKLK